MTTARELTSGRVVIGAEEERLAQVASRMELRGAQHCVVLSRDQRALGLIRLVDVAARTFSGNRILADLVSGVAPLAVKASTPAAEVAALLEASGIGEAVVEEDDKTFVGLVTLESAFRWMLKENREARGALEEHLAERDRLNGILEKKVEQRTTELRAALDEFRFASLSLSHDVRAPLRSIQGYVELLMGGDVGELSPQAKQTAQAIKRAATKLELMAAEILSKAERTFAVNSAPVEAVDLNSIFDDVLDFHRELLGRRKALVSKRGALESVMGTYVPVLQIIGNLLSNAVKYVPDSRQPIIEVWTELGPEQVSFCIKDNGPGVPPEHHELVFEPFGRVPRTDRGGFGLGLAIAKGAARYVGGEIRFRSEENAGSVFTVNFRKPFGTAAANTAAR